MNVQERDSAAALQWFEDLTRDDVPTVGGKNAPDELFVFANQNKLPLTDIKRIYGKPTAEYVADDNSRYLFYGRIFFCLVQGTEVPYVARFNISNKDDGTYLREPK